MSGASSAGLAADIPAVLQAATSSETVYGGEILAWSAVAALWITLKPGAASSDQLDGQRPVRIETAAAEARDDARAAAGQQLLAEGDAIPWRVLAVERAQPQPGRMTLRLDRRAP